MKLLNRINSLEQKIEAATPPSPIDIHFHAAGEDIPEYKSNADGIKPFVFVVSEPVRAITVTRGI